MSNFSDDYYRYISLNIFLVIINESTIFKFSIVYEFNNVECHNGKRKVMKRDGSL